MGPGLLLVTTGESLRLPVSANENYFCEMQFNSAEIGQGRDESDCHHLLTSVFACARKSGELQAFSPFIFLFFSFFFLFFFNVTNALVYTDQMYNNLR